jgi:signal transduction histidine kinase
VRIPAHLSEESLFGFLTSTRLPVVSSLATLIRWISLGLAVACSLLAAVTLLVAEDSWWSASLPWSGALPAMVGAPLFFAAWRDWRRHRLQRAATLLLTGLFALTILVNWPRGALSPSWYVHPVLALVATMSLGVIPGLTMTLVAVAAMLAATEFHADTIANESWHWEHTTSLAAVVLASALTGAIVNRLVFMALMTAESQRRKNFESSRALRHREKLLRHALRVETIGDLAGMVCHQLRNTFQVLMGHVTLGSMADSAERARRLELIEQTLSRAQPLLDQLMRLAHPDESAPQACDIAAMLREFHQQARLVLPETIDLVCEAPESCALVLIDPHGLTHALWNLTINAKQAISGEGRITFRAGTDQHQVWIEVEDTGSGIPKQIQERIFDPYFTTKPRGQGTGLGLTAVARYMRSSNGVVQVESEVGRGTTFRLRLPRASHVRLVTPEEPRPSRPKFA